MRARATEFSAAAATDYVNHLKFTKSPGKPPLFTATTSTPPQPQENYSPPLLPGTGTSNSDSLETIAEEA